MESNGSALPGPGREPESKWPSHTFRHAGQPSCRENFAAIRRSGNLLSPAGPLSVAEIAVEGTPNSLQWRDVSSSLGRKVIFTPPSFGLEKLSSRVVEPGVGDGAGLAASVAGCKAERSAPSTS